MRREEKIEERRKEKTEKERGGVWKKKRWSTIISQ
jgi:hypothetical protein